MLMVVVELDKMNPINLELVDKLVDHPLVEVITVVKRVEQMERQTLVVVEVVVGVLLVVQVVLVLLL